MWGRSPTCPSENLLKKRVWIEILTALFAGALLFAAATTTPPAASNKTTKKTKKKTSSTSKANSTKRRKKPAVASWRSTQKAPSPERYKEIQQALASKGYLQPDASSGVWDNSSVSALKKFQEDQVDVVVLDLRQNGGGSLTESINLTGLFIDTGPVVQVKDADKRVQHYDDQERGMTWTGPLVVLTSKFSASASEIFAGAIQDYRRGLVVGDTSTHGKGTVQSLLDLGRQLFRVPNAPQLGALKITMQQFYRPNGDSTQNRGVLADLDLPSITNQLDVGESSLDYAVKFDNVGPAQYQPYERVNPKMIQELKADSVKRREGSKDWEKVDKNIARYNEQKKRKRVSLNEQVFLSERAEVNADKEEEKEIEKLSNPNRPVFDMKSFYNQEVLAIAADYVKALQTPPAATVGRR